jgi:cobalt-zinc-cadmium efflux system protein
MSVNAVPSKIDPQAVRRYLETCSGVSSVHDLHIWAMSTTEVALTVHLVMEEVPSSDLFLNSVSDTLRDRFGIGHATTQIECGSCEHDCRQAPV